eukprot:TRINITY_DN22268_c0_g1_i1.p1 TRINITY_DN22268_c0_g1~~TRINITY_DN22268_c0_g1_i1.p1  ORF type:complete len:438 (-),score=125.02 TRINITY_DN22268_c0_g1_i1:63-1376(-)
MAIRRCALRLSAAVYIQFVTGLRPTFAAILVTDEDGTEDGEGPWGTRSHGQGEGQGSLVEKRKAQPKKQALKGQGLAEVSALSQFRSYHNGAAIIDKLEKLSDSCGVPMKTGWAKDTEGQGKIFSVNLGNPEAEKTVMVAANEHARELLTAEVALRFVEMACDEKKSGSLLEMETGSVAKLMQNVKFVVLPVINQKGREIVETNQDLCQRMTPNDEGHVDLNRNMEVDWGQGEPQEWGTKPFSAYQTRIMRDVAKKAQPVAYVDLHTGARSLMTSWGYKRMATSDLKDQSKLLKEVQKKHCEDCRIGPNSIVIGYGNPGEIIDHMYATQGIKYSTLWELYGGGGGECIDTFNPKDDEYEKHVKNWASALFTVGDYVNTKVDATERSRPDEVPFEEEGKHGLLEEHGRSAALLEREAIVEERRVTGRTVNNEPFPFTS